MSRNIPFKQRQTFQA